MPVITRSKSARRRRSRYLNQISSAPPVQIPVAGYFYPFVGEKPVVRIATYDVYEEYLHQTKGMTPAVDLGLIFQPSPPGYPYRTTQAVIRVRHESYLIIGYHRDPLDRPKEINQTLLKVLPNLNWRGELIVFHIGSRVPLLSREPSNNADLRSAVTSFLCDETASINTKRDTTKTRRFYD